MVLTCFSKYPNENFGTLCKIRYMLIISESEDYFLCKAGLSWLRLKPPKVRLNSLEKN